MSAYHDDWHGQEAREEAAAMTEQPMSAALDACHDWQRENRELMWTLEGRDRDEMLFVAGYRRALEDAAKDMDGDRTLWHVLEAAIERASGPASGADAAQDEAAKWVRDRAAAVAPRETKD